MNISELPECRGWQRYWAAKEEGNLTEMEQYQLVKVKRGERDKQEIVKKMIKRFRGGQTPQRRNRKKKGT